MLPSRPVILVPTRMGKISPCGPRPMRREKNGNGSCMMPPKLKMPASCRKNARFSGKNKGKRVRLTRRSSTSASAKSVFTVSAAVIEGVT